MKNVSDSVKKSLLKRKEAMERFVTKKETFLLSKAQITRDIEEARIIWMQTLEQLPFHEFSEKKTTTNPKPVVHSNRLVSGITRSSRKSTYKTSSHHE
jgi:hypothetical protein